MDDPLNSQESFHPVTVERLGDLDRFSRHHGKFRYCSCMRWRLSSSEFQRSTKEQRASRLEQMVVSDTPVGVLAYVGGEPVGWCSMGPRESFAGLERSRTLARVDDMAVWSVTCFFVDARQRHRGLQSRLLDAAIDYACTQGADVIEAYPVDPGSPSYRFMGFTPLFERAGFVDVTPPGRTRSVVRLMLGASAQQRRRADDAR
ncbi:MAG: GNAT family N-acetyltransferase [Coriobacteriia bacterium]|nr:GNAT family N-acetyltransferase [Coriobacteriia bacterium]